MSPFPPFNAKRERGEKKEEKRGEGLILISNFVGMWG